MDLSTIRQNLNDNYYDEPADVNSDMKLMFKNCYTYNPPGSPVNGAGKALQAVWEEKWRALPPKEEESEPEQESDDEGALLTTQPLQHMGHDFAPCLFFFLLATDTDTRVYMLLLYFSCII